jgi:RecB family exonuclease
LSFGSSVHAALEFFYSVIEGAEPYSLERLLRELDNVWLSEGYESLAHQQEYKDKGRAILTKFYEANVAAFAKPVAVEQRFAISLGNDLTLSGIIDRIDRRPDGGFEIIDYKTNGKLPPRTKIKTDLQLPIYHMAVEDMYGIAPKQVTLYFLVPGEKMSASKTKTDIDRAKDTIYKVADGIKRDTEHGLFEPLGNPLCPWCDFIELCPMHKNDPVIMAKAAANGKLAGLAARKEQSSIQNQPATSAMITELKKSATQIERVVDEYFDLVNTIEAARTRLNELQPVIHEYCEKNKLASIRGTHGQLSRSARKTTHYNIDKLRALLEPRGLWEKVLDVNGALLKQLLEDSASEDELRKLIATAKEVEEIGYVLYIKDEPADE